MRIKDIKSRYELKLSHLIMRVMYVLCRVNFKPFYHTKDIMTVIFIVMIDNCLLSTASDKGAQQSFLVKSFKSRLFSQSSEGIGSSWEELSIFFSSCNCVSKIVCNSLVACDIKGTNGNDRGNIPIILFLYK